MRFLSKTKSMLIAFALLILSVLYTNATLYEDEVRDLIVEAKELDHKIKTTDKVSIKNLYKVHLQKVLNTISTNLLFTKCADFIRAGLTIPTGNYILFGRNTLKPNLVYCEMSERSVIKQEMLFSIQPGKDKYSISWEGLGENYFYSMASKTEVSEDKIEINAPCVGANNLLNKTKYIFDGSCKATNKVIKKLKKTEVRICTTQLGQWDHKESIICTGYLKLKKRLRFKFPAQQVAFHFPKKYENKRIEVDAKFMKNGRIRHLRSCIGADRLSGRSSWKFVRLCDNKEIVPLDSSSKVALCRVGPSNKRICTSYQTLDKDSIVFPEW